MIPLEQIRVAAPCSASWAEMNGSEQVRFCGGCRKNVYNLSAMSHDEAQALVTRMEECLCVRFYRRADGTMLTRDCPVGLRAARFRLAKKCSYAATLLLACGASLLPGAANADQFVRQAHRVRARVKPHMTSRRVRHSMKKQDKQTLYVTAGEMTVPLPPPLVEPPKPVELPPPPPPIVVPPLPVPPAQGK